MAAVGLGDMGGTGAGDMISGLGEALGAGYDAAMGEDTPGGEAGSEPSLPTEGNTETPGGEGLDHVQAAPEEPAQPEVTPEAQPQADNSPWKLSQDGKSYLMPKAELPRVQSAMQYADAVGQFFATPQDAQTAAGQASDLRQMSNDWMYGSDAAIQSVMNHWMGSNHQDPGARAAFARSFSRMVGMGVAAMKTSNPQGHQQIMSEVGKSLVDSLWEKAAASNDPADIRSAQNIEWALSPTGEYRKEPPKVDPAAQQRADFERQRSEFNARQEAGMKRDTIAFNNTAVEGAKMGQLGAAIDKLLQPVRSRYNDVAYGDLKAGIHKEIVDSLAKSEWFTEHKQQFDQLIADYRHTWQQGNPGQNLQPRVNAYIQDFMARASRVLPSIAQKRINANTQARVSSAQPNRTANQPSRPAPQAQPQNGTPKRLSREEYDREWAAVFR